MPLPDLLHINGGNPATAAPYPQGLALDLALNTAPIQDILAAYGLDQNDFVRIAQDPNFKREYQALKEEAKEDGFSFRMKAKAQAEAMLKESWKLVHDPDAPANVRADLIKWTAAVGGYAPKTAANAQSPQENLAALAEQLKSMPASELELKVLSIVLRQQPLTTTTPSATPIGQTYDADA